MSRPVIILCDPGFPAEGTLPEEALLRGMGTVVRAEGLAEALSSAASAAGGTFVNLHAPYFPKQAWTAILSFLKQGGGLLSIGGAPFKFPVRREQEGWKVEAEQTAYHQELYIHEALRVDSRKVAALAASETIPLLAGQEELFPVSDTWNLIPHTTRDADLPQQMGSAGTMSTQIYPLLTGISADGREIAAPVVLWENSRGVFKGSRWLFVHLPLPLGFWSEEGLQALGKWITYCAKGVTELSLKPNYASYEPGERPLLTLQTERLTRQEHPAGPAEKWSFNLTVEPENNGRPAWNHRFHTLVSSEQSYMRISVPLEVESGFHRITCRAEAPDGEVRILRQGFWGHDARLLAEGEPVRAGRDYFVKEGRPLPIVGMTYMASDVARKFLFLPNADVWDRDMDRMAKAGINWIRTGVWTAYRNIMQVDGHASEEVLRAIDAFLLTAKKHGLQVTFTFFSFTPETWEGVNPYLDPHSVEAQKRFIRSIVSRHTASTHVDWDLINEPSMFDPPRIFSYGPRSARDGFEKEAYIRWIKERHGMIELLQERWNMSPQQLPDFGSVEIPEAEEINFDIQDMRDGKKGTRWLDYCLFSMEMHNVWAKQLTAAIKDLSPDQLVTVGQDEALGAQRPSPFFYEQAVDYTTVHSWWFNDYLVWDSVFAKTPNKPCVAQETGIMYVETPDGRAKRTEAELKSLLERKYAYAFSTGGAGAIQWIWNTNFYMNNANESHIGALRADGTEKPEAEVSYDFGHFIREARDLFTGRQLEDIAVIFPYSNDFSNRSLAFAATTRLIRVLSYQLKLPLRAASEYHLEALREHPAKLILLPSVHNMDDAAMAELLEIVKSTGATLLATGPLGLDAYWHPSDRVDELLGKRKLGNVRREEMLILAGKELPVSFGHRRIAELAKEVPAESEGPAQEGEPTAKQALMDQVVELQLGAGRLIWSPLPVELNDRDEPIAELYRYAASRAGVRCELEWIQGGELPGIYGQKLSMDRGSLYVFVSEYAWDAEVEVKDRTTGTVYRFLLERERSVLFTADLKGGLLSVYRPHEVTVHEGRN
ncbi:glycoside hydrolase [Paenibacillus sp. CAA11]|uniref:beta-galactosidase n=1 Tax=Paenibacillus sp. CAA11 TaxID=1532905 RepID=UPI000D3CF17F|nr:beta-galactosidase [Paenibacillus sp. CAA11]AWB43092.1 glycoside hydrolase [Paenibacillus sp. CAA11]